MVAVIIAYADRKIADNAIATLRDKGFADHQVRILNGPTKKLAGELLEQGFNDVDAHAYATAVGEGKFVVVADVGEDKADQAQSIMDGVASGKGRPEEDGAGFVSIVEEAFSVTKAKTTNGGVRVTSSVSETPVEATVTLTTETVAAERRSADRLLKGDEIDAAFVGKTIAMMGTREEAEVRKEARVVGEVVITRDVKERQQTIKDTVRKTGVEIEQIGAGSKK